MSMRFKTKTPALTRASLRWRQARLSLLTSGFALMAGWAVAQDAALLLDTDRYEQLGRVSRGADILDAEPGLADLGFRVAALRNGRAQAMALTLSDFAATATSADRIIVVATGRFATDGTRSWFLTAEADAPGILTVGQVGVSLDSLLAVLAAAPGEAALLLGVEEPEGDAFDPWLSEGLGDFAIPQGVTVIVGTPRDIAAFAQSDLIEPGADLAALLAEWTSLSVQGFAPRVWQLMPETATPVVTLPPVAVVDPSTEDALWDGAVALDTVESYRGYLNRYPAGRYATEAEQVIADIIADPNRASRKAEEALNLTRDQRRDIQRDLTILDFNTRGIDGIFGPGSRRAIANWQQENGFGQSTYVTTDQISRLDAQATRRAAELEAEAERKRREDARLDRAYWDETGARGDEPGFRAYMSRYPDGLFAQVATERLAAIEAGKRAAAEAEDRAAWDRARGQDVIAAYHDYLRAFPDGVFKAEANARVAELTQSNPDTSANRAALAEEQALGLSPITARLVEARLGQLGLEPGPVDGTFDAATRRALRRYQRARDLPVTGFLTEATIVRLLADSIGTLGR